MKGTCLVVRAVAPSIPAERLSTGVNAHVTACLACQAELIRYAKLRRHLAGLENETDPAPARLAAAVDDAIGIGVVPRGVRPASFHPARAAAAAGAVVVAAAGTAAVAWLRHARTAAHA